MLFGSTYRRQQEPVVVACEKACATAAIQKGYSVVVDDTNLSVGSMWRDLAESLGVKHSTRFLDVTVEEAIRRDSQRPKPVGAAAIRATAKKL